MIRFLLTILLSLSSWLSYAQFYNDIEEIDPYKKKLAAIDSYLNLSPQKGEALIKELRDVAKADKNKTLETTLDIYEGTMLYYTGRYKDALEFFQKATKDATELDNARLRSTASIRRLFILHNTSHSSAILSLMENEYEIAKENNDTVNMIYSLNGQALCHETLDNYEACTKAYMEAIELAKSNDNQFEYGFLLNNLGLLKMRFNSPEEAYKDFKKGLEIADKLNNIRLQLTLRENLGFYYLRIDSVDMAIKEYDETYQIATEKNYSHLAFNCLINRGVIERSIGNYKASDSLMTSALNIAKRDKLFYALSPIYLTMAQIQTHDGNFDSVRSYLDSASIYATYNSPNEVQENIYRVMYRLLEKEGNYKEALTVYKRLSHFQDSINKTGLAQMITELQMKYDLERQEKIRAEEKIDLENELAENERHNNRLKQNIAIIVILLILAIAGFIIYYFRQKHRKETFFSSALSDKLEEEKGRIARDLHDGLGQSLVILKNKFNHLDLSSEEDIERLNQNFAETIEEVRSIARSLIPPELKRLGLKKAVAKMFREIQENTELITTLDLDALNQIELDSEQEIRIYRIIQELTSNTIKHSKATSLKLDSDYHNNRLTITYYDNGIGLEKESFEVGNSLGFMNIEQRLKYLNGTIRYEKPAKGFKAIIKIKLEKA